MAVPKTTTAALRAARPPGSRDFLDELGEDAKQFVRTSPGMAVGMAVAAGFVLGRIFKGK